MTVFLCLTFAVVTDFQTQAFLTPSPILGTSSYSRLLFSQKSGEMASREDVQKVDPTSRQTSLISSFLVDIISSSSLKGEGKSKDVWSLRPIADLVDSENLSSGAKSWKALHLDSKELPSTTPTATLTSEIVGDNTIEVQVLHATATPDNKKDEDLLSVLSKIIAQTTASHAEKDEETKWDLKISMEEGNSQEPIIHSGVMFSIHGIQQLFETADANVEIVDMVNSQGDVLGMVPRTLVHSLNILHRGIGMTVSKDADFSELYVHRRTDFKRIFPSLYDMFVGGVSGSGEDAKLTAAREVAEELGLTRALNNDTSDALSDPLFSCVVCTSYNRCFVTVFQYTMDSSTEKVSWQEEEVSWGEFVPYNIVEAAADLSIRRLVSKGGWPGTLPAVQSKWKGNLPSDKRKFETVGSEEWATWDFVPDGLLVWEAWLRWRDNR